MSTLLFYSKIVRPLDIFKRVRQNEGIKGKLEAWLTFLSSDEPEDIVRLITDYPEFKVIYDEVYNLCLNVEKVMEMFSKELKELDQNTVQLMIDEMQEEIDFHKRALSSKDAELESKDVEIESQKKELESKDEKLAFKDVEIETQKKELASKNVEIETQRKELKSQADRIKELEEKLKAFTK